MSQHFRRRDAVMRVNFVPRTRTLADTLPHVRSHREICKRSISQYVLCDEKQVIKIMVLKNIN